MYNTTCMYVYVYMCVCVCVCVYLSLSLYIYICIYTYHIHISIYLGGLYFARVLTFYSEASVAKRCGSGCNFLTDGNRLTYMYVYTLRTNFG